MADHPDGRDHDWEPATKRGGSDSRTWSVCMVPGCNKVKVELQVLGSYRIRKKGIELIIAGEITEEKDAG